MFTDPWMRVDQFWWRVAAVGCCVLGALGAALVGGWLAIGVYTMVGGAAGAVACFFCSLGD